MDGYTEKGCQKPAPQQQTTDDDDDPYGRKFQLVNYRPFCLILLTDICVSVCLFTVLSKHYLPLPFSSAAEGQVKMIVRLELIPQPTGEACHVPGYH